MNITVFDKKDFINKVDTLSRNQFFRKTLGSLCAKSVPNKNDFNRGLREILRGVPGRFDFLEDDIDISYRAKVNMNTQTKFQFEVLAVIFNNIPPLLMLIPFVLINKMRIRLNTRMK